MKNEFRVPPDEIERRIRHIQGELQQNELDGLFVVQRVDLFYFSGTAQNGFLYIPAEGNPHLLIRRYTPRAMRESSIRHILEISTVKEVPRKLTEFYGHLPRTLGGESTA